MVRMYICIHQKCCHDFCYYEFSLFLHCEYMSVFIVFLDLSVGLCTPLNHLQYNKKYELSLFRSYDNSVLCRISNEGFMRIKLFICRVLMVCLFLYHFLYVVCCNLSACLLCDALKLCWCLYFSGNFCMSCGSVV